MENKDSLFVNLRVFEQGIFGINIPRNEEEKYRRAAADLSEAIKRYRSRFPKAPDVKILTMAALTFAFKSLTAEGNIDMHPLLGDLQAIDTDLQKYLDTTASE